MIAEPSITVAGQCHSDDARRRLLAVRGEPLFFSDWLHPLFLHYAIEPDRLQSAVPFPLELYKGKAWVSLVAFTMSGLRPRLGGNLGARLFRPIATHGLLNVRTYVCREKESGIYFLTEWIPNPLSVWLGPVTFGLPYRLGKLAYDHRHETGRLRGTVTDGAGTLAYRATLPVPARFGPCEPGSLAEFLLERYTAFTCHGSRRKLFRIWHPPWQQTEVQTEVTQDSLLRRRFPWFRDAQLVAANYSPSSGNVWMGRPHRLARGLPTSL